MIEFQIGQNPEYTFSLCHNFCWHRGEFALPIKIGWWNHMSATGDKNCDIDITILCFQFSLEIWEWIK